MDVYKQARLCLARWLASLLFSENESLACPEKASGGHLYQRVSRLTSFDGELAAGSLLLSADRWHSAERNCPSAMTCSIANEPVVSERMIVSQRQGVYVGNTRALGRVDEGLS
jgi:hypothetical protein